MTVEASVDNQWVGHRDTLWFHGMFFGVDEFAEVGIVEVGDLALSFDIHSGLNYIFDIGLYRGKVSLIINQKTLIFRSFILMFNIFGRLKNNVQLKFDYIINAYIYDPSQKAKSI